MYAVRVSLKPYLAAVLRQWWIYAVFLATLAGLIVNVIRGFDIPSAVWISIFAACLFVATFRVYHDLHHQQLLRNRGLELPQWAMWACNASGEGTWLTLLVVGDRPRVPFDTTSYRRLVAAVGRHFNLAEGSCETRSYPGLIRVTVPGSTGTLRFQVELGVARYGIVCIHSRVEQDPLSLIWLLQSLDHMMGFVLSDAVDDVIGRKHRQYTMCLADRPASGIDFEGLVRVKRLSDNYVQGNRVTRQYTPDKRDQDGWNTVCKFAGEVFAESGYIEFEPDLSALTRDRLRRASAHEPTSVQSPPAP